MLVLLFIDCVIVTDLCHLGERPPQDSKLHIYFNDTCQFKMNALALPLEKTERSE